MTKKKTIFETLFNNDICFSVCVSLETPNLEGVGIVTREYFVLCDGSDLIHLGGYRFKKRKDEFKGLVERDLSDLEIEEFKRRHFDKFEKVVHNSLGRAYELKGNSFKEKFKEKYRNETITDYEK